AVGLPSRSRVQTSYTQVARTAAALHGLDGRLRRSEEADLPDNSPTEIVADAWLPRGAKTGDALHEILEEWMDPSHDNSWLQTDPVPEAKIAFVARTLSLHGLDGTLAPRVAQLLVSVLRAPLTLPTGRVVRLCEIESGDRRPETEFHWAFGPDGKPADPQGPVKGWMVGYIDLLFRIDKIWYVLDWKTTSLSGWDAAALTDSVMEHAYDLQAKLYGRTVASALPPGETFGGAIVLYLRAFADAATSGSGAWVARPSEDGDEIARRLRAWLHERGRFAAGGAA
ncbi:MAG: PD-(D/E)XK nuclease family protein, partial [Fibrobacterota bacterium]